MNCSVVIFLEIWVTVALTTEAQFKPVGDWWGLFLRAWRRQLHQIPCHLLITRLTMFADTFVAAAVLPSNSVIPVASSWLWSNEIHSIFVPFGNGDFILSWWRDPKATPSFLHQSNFTCCLCHASIQRMPRTTNRGQMPTWRLPSFVARSLSRRVIYFCGFMSSVS